MAYIMQTGKNKLRRTVLQRSMPDCFISMIRTCTVQSVSAVTDTEMAVLARNVMSLHHYTIRISERMIVAHTYAKADEVCGQ